MKLGELIKELEKKRQKYGDDIEVIRLSNHEFFLSRYPNDKTEHWYFYCQKPKTSSKYKWNGMHIGRVVVL